MFALVSVSRTVHIVCAQEIFMDKWKDERKDKYMDGSMDGWMNVAQDSELGDGRFRIQIGPSQVLRFSQPHGSALSINSIRIRRQRRTE